MLFVKSWGTFWRFSIYLIDSVSERHQLIYATGIHEVLIVEVLIVIVIFAGSYL